MDSGQKVLLLTVGTSIVQSFFAHTRNQVEAYELTPPVPSKGRKSRRKKD